MQLQPEPTLLAHGLLQDPGAVPLVIAVAGHRDPRPEFLRMLQQNLRAQLEQLIRELPHTPLLMLNGLAEGIDSMAAHVFLEVIQADRLKRGSEAPHHQLVAALPKTPDDYMNDFADPKALADLQQLLHCCDGILHPGNCSDLVVPCKKDGSRLSHDEAACYGQQGIFLVRHCYLLVAFFDGTETKLVGGTSQTVAMQKGHIHPLFVSVDEVLASKEPGALVVHHTPRIKEGSPLAGAGSVCFWMGATGDQPNRASGDVELPERLLAIPRLIETMNAKLQWPGFQATCYDQAEGRYTRLWSLVDDLAGENKKSYERWCRVLVIAGFLLVLLAQLSPVAQGLWWALLLLAFIVFPRLQQGPKHAFISERCLAECLTVQHLWIALGVDDDAADLFHTRSNTELGWIRTVLRAVRLQLLSFHSKESLSFNNAMNKALIWINGQVTFLERRIREFQAKANKWKLLAIGMAAVAVILATAASLPGVSVDFSPWVVVLLAGFASALAYSNLIGYADTADRYRRSLNQFQRARSALSAVDSELDGGTAAVLARQKIVVEAIGREKLDELNDWVASQLQRVYSPGT